MSTSSVLSIVALAAGVAVMLVVHVVVILWALRRGGRAEEERADQGCGGEGRQGLSVDELDTLPCYDFKDAGGGGGDCAVCLEAFEAGDRCRRLPKCEHGFHAPCVDPWLEKSRCCPVCRAAVVVVGDRRKGETKAAGEPSSMEIAERRSPVPAAATLDIVLATGLR